MKLNVAASGEEATIEFNACAVPRDDHQVSFLQRSDSSAAVDYGRVSSHASRVKRIGWIFIARKYSL